jgi:murein DD-endopeptidase MepM/ murein hydrolase activator NlpD
MRKFTVIVVSHDGGKKRSFIVTSRLIKSALFSLCLIIVGVSTFAFIRWQINHRMQQSQAQRIEQLEASLNELHQMDTQIRTLLGVRQRTSEDLEQGIGGRALMESTDSLQGTPPFIPAKSLPIEPLEDQIDLQEKSFAELLTYAQQKNNELAAIPTIWPVKGWISSGFGRRTNPFTGKREFHEGIDIVNALGVPILAPADGRVITTKKDPGFGLFLKVDHGYGYETVYGHLLKFAVIKGEWVTRGEIIAYLGNTGMSTGPHLHYEIHKNGKAVNPWWYLLD